jgi:acetyl esterase/lipase
MPLKKTLRKVLVFISVAVLLFVLAVIAAFTISPKPVTFCIRQAFNRQGEKTNDALFKHVPAGITSVPNEHYDADDKDAFLDVYFPSSIQNTKISKPLIVWIHGGGWVSGDKSQVANYCKIIASRGYTVAAVNYSIAPGKTYPTPVLQANMALHYLLQNAKRLHADTSHIILAGDSGGSQIAAQVANIIAEPSYALELNVEPAVRKGQLAGTVLFCGAYDARNLNIDTRFVPFVKMMLWSYCGERDFMDNPKFAPASVIDYVTPNFPATFISVGDDDPLAIQSYRFAEKLDSLHVQVETLFFADDHKPELSHEFQFNLDNGEGKLALKRVEDFLKALK